MLVIALALVLLAAACAVVLTEASRSVIPPMAPVVRQVAAPVAATIPTQRLAGEIGSAKADAAHRAYAFIAELPAEKNPGVDKTL
jgi:hypothetical protein